VVRTQANFHSANWHLRDNNYEYSQREAMSTRVN